MLRLTLWCALLSLTFGRDVVYYLQAEEIDWDYAPGGRDIVHTDQTNIKSFLGEKDNLVYRKVVYREYTNESYSVMAPRPDHLGIVGPTLQTRVGDTLVVHFRNAASHPHSVHPTRLQYSKAYEGSANEDGSSSGQRQDDAILPGHTFTYKWNIAGLNTTVEDVRCTSALYYSDTDRSRDVNAGLVGIILICRADYNFNSDVQNINLLFQTYDENISWYGTGFDNAPEETRTRKRLHSVNGFVFGNMPSPQLCTGNDVIIHVASLGSTSEPHTVRIHGHSVIYTGKRQHAVPVFPASTVDAVFTPVETGSWLLTSQNPTLRKSGMQAILDISDCGLPALDLAVTGVIRRVFIAIESVRHPNGRTGIGFIQYANRAFTTKVPRQRSQDYLGVLGPVITAEIGDLIKVVLKNDDVKPHSLQSHGGVRVHKYHEGAFYNDSTDSRPVRPGYQKTYYWTVSEFSGPTPFNAPCLPTYYTSGVDVTSEIHAGLIGPMIICQAGLLEPNGNKILGLQNLFLFYIRSKTLESDEVHGLNGFGPGAFPRLDMATDETVLLHAMNIGYDYSATSLTTDGNPLTVEGAPTFAIGLHHGLIRSAKLVGRRQGQWDVGNSGGADLSFRYSVGSGLETRDPGNATRELFIKIEESDVDYTNGKVSETEWRGWQEGRYKMGPVYRKAQYKCKLSNHFSWACRGGNLIWAKVGSSIKITLWNHGTFPFSIYTEGVSIIRVDGGTQLAVQPEKRVEFIWTFTEASGPGDGHENCVMRAYYSNANPQKDVASGLIGPLIVCRDDVSLEKAMSYSSPLLVGVVDETKSWYMEQNIADFLPVDKSDPSFIRNNRIAVPALGYRGSGYVKNVRGILNQDTELYLYNIGDFFHSLHFHGCTITASGDSDEQLLGQNVVPLYPGETKHVIVTSGNTGNWIFEGMSDVDAGRKMFGQIEITEPAKAVLS